MSLRERVVNGQKKPFDEEQEAVDKYVEEIGLYEEKEPLRFNIKAYARYMMEHELDNPDDVPPEVMETFWIQKNQQTA